MSNWFIGLIIGSAVATSALAQQEREGDVIRRWKTGVTRTEWQSGSRDFRISSVNMDPSAAIEVKQMLVEETAEQYVFRAARREERMVWETRTRKICQRPDGSEYDEGLAPGEGEKFTLTQTDDPDAIAGDSGEWNEFAGGRTAEGLNKAIKGLGIRVAQRIIDDGTLFRTKPRTWRAFLAEVQRAVDKGLMSAEVQELVTVTYADENKRRLGLKPGPAPTPKPPVCRIVREPVLVRKYVDFPAEYAVRVGQPVLRQINVEFVRVSVRTSGNIQLLPHEADILRVTVDNFGRVNTGLVSAVNQYSITHQNVSRTDIVINMVGLGRSANVALPTAEELFVRAPELVQDPSNPNRIFLRLEVRPHFFTNDSGQELEFTYVAYQSSGLSQYDYKKFDNYAERTVVLNKSSRTLEIDLWGAGRQRHISVGLSGMFKNSPWFPSKTFALGMYKISSR